MNRQRVVSSRMLRTNWIVVGCLFSTLAGAVMVSCKQIDSRVSTAGDAGNGQGASIETLTAKENTSLKTNLVSGGVGDGFCPVPQGTVLIVESLKHEGIDHWRLFDLVEVRLPTGEIGKVQRSLNEDVKPETRIPSELVSSAPAATPVAGSSPSPVGDPKATPAATSNGNVPTPAQLLNCNMLNAESFLVVSRHFDRLLGASAQQRRPGASAGASESAAIDDGAFVWPTRGRNIRNDSGGSGYFGAPRASGRGHQGIDIVAAVGEPVYASRAGTIVDPAFEYSYGNVVDVKHEEGYSSRYAHLTSFSYSHGSYVEKGAKIASSGRSGNASGYGITPHLHFEIRQYGRLLNPSKILP
ncbi:MAG: M23 family metallopeptidase [Silvanigrellaceae bacterium]